MAAGYCKFHKRFMNLEKLKRKDVDVRLILKSLADTS